MKTNYDRRDCNFAKIEDEESDGEENCVFCDKKLGKKGGCGGTGLCAGCCLGEADATEADY